MFAVLDEDEALNEGHVAEPFDPSRIRVEPKTQTMENLIERMRHGEIVLQPEFQRAEVWKETARSRLIESLLIRIPLPAFYVDATDDDRWQVIDGQQRLSTIRDFVIEKKLKLQNLEFLTEYEGFGFDSLPQSLKRRIRETNVIVYRIEPGTPEEVKFNIFRRINTGGLPLSAQEIRHALNQGPATKMLQHLAESDEFLTATDRGVSPLRMNDRECVLRFLAFVLTDPEKFGAPEFDAFLTWQMKALNSMTDDERDRLCERFRKSMRRASQLFEKDAFRKYSNGTSKGQPINKALFESWSVALDGVTPFHFEMLLRRRERLQVEWNNLIADPEMLNSVSQGTGKPAKVIHRFRAVRRLVESVLDA